VKDEVVTV